jgi:hypothetical protein
VDLEKALTPPTTATTTIHNKPHVLEVGFKEGYERKDNKMKEG